MKKTIFLTIICLITISALTAWAGISTSNYAERSVANLPAATDVENKIALYGNDSYQPLRLDTEVTGDDCSDPFVIGGFPYQDTQDNTTFLDDYNYNGGLTGPDLVYEFTITECKDVTISLCNSPDNTMDLAVSLYGPGDCGGTAIGFDDDACVAPDFGTPELVARLAAGTYYFIIDAYDGFLGTYVVDVTVEDCPIPPPYDDCTDVDPADSVLAIGDSLFYVGDNAGATLDSNCDSLTTEMSWIGFTTTELSDVTIEFCGTVPVRQGYYRVLSAYCPCDGDNFYFASEENYTDCADENPTLYFNRLPAGEWWYPVIAGPTLEGPYNITVMAGPPTGYCDYTCDGGATPEGEVCGDDDNGGCNSEPPEFGSISCGEHICGELWADGGTRDTDWFSFTPATDTFITWSAAGAMPISLILIDYTVGCDTSETVYLGGGGTTECDTISLTAFVEAGHSIACFISANDIYSGYPCEDGPFYYEAWLTCEVFEAPENDNCVDAIEIGEVTEYAWTNLGATTDNNGTCGTDLQADVWYRYTPSCTGAATLDLCLPENAGFDTYIGVFTDDCVDPECIVFGDDDCGEGGGPSRVSWAVVAGEPVLLCLGGWAGTMGEGLFTVSCSPPATIDVQPTSVSGAAAPGGVDMEALTVSNTGDGTLYWEIITYQDFPTMTSNSNGAPIGERYSINNDLLSAEKNFSLVEKEASAEKKEVNENNLVKGLRADQTGDFPEPPSITDYCEILTTGDAYYTGGGWFTGGEMYAVYQDPEVCGYSPTYPFTVTSLSWALAKDDTSAATAEYVYYQPVIFGADLTNPSCPVPDTSVLLYAGALDSVFFEPGDYLWIGNNISAVVNGPYFMAVIFPYTHNFIRLPLEQTNTGTCLSYNEYGSGWIDLGENVWNLNLANYWRTDGLTPTVCDVECPAGGIAEAEVCGDENNNGCNMDPVTFETINCNTTICGTGWATGGFRDTDWYEFTLTAPTFIHISVETEFPTDVYLLDVPSCDSIGAYAIISLTPCDPGTITGTLPAGTYVIFVGASVGENVLCDGTGLYGYEYYVTLQCMDPWLSVDTYSGECPPNATVNVIMDATYLSEGTYYGDVVFYSSDTATPELDIPVEFVVAAGGYEYLPGDANMAAGAWPPNVIGADVTYLVNYFRAIASPCLLGGYYASGDANGDCLVIGADVTYLVQYFRGANTIKYCGDDVGEDDYTPAWLNTGELPPSAPAGWPNCE